MTDKAFTRAKQIESRLDDLKATEFKKIIKENKKNLR